MPIIAGLGNPGEQYSNTRHNIGFDIADALAEKLNCDFEKGNGPYMIATGKHKGMPVYIIKPLTYMNRSGDALYSASRFFHINPSDILICYDDIAIPTASVRLRKKGSDGGHNGMKDIIAKLGTSAFPRLRFGVGSEFGTGQQADYVLSPFQENEQQEVRSSVDHSVEAALCFVREGIEKAMNLFNKKK